MTTALSVKVNIKEERIRHNHDYAYDRLWQVIVQGTETESGKGALWPWNNHNKQKDGVRTLETS